jgi:mono/diheme cytochrome c family protein
MLVWLAWPSLRLLLVPAEPTYYWQSESAGDADSVARGRAVYAQNCVGCHGAGGKGDGVLAAGLAEPPADLTAPHLWEHSDGELYWWINHGMAGPDGRLVMPGLNLPAGALEVWNVIDFLHANNPNGAVLPHSAHHHG